MSPPPPPAASPAIVTPRASTDPSTRTAMARPDGARPARRATASGTGDHDAPAARPRRTALALGIYAGAFGVSFGAIATASGLTTAQAVILSLVMCSGASQFAFVGVLAGGGQALAAGLAAALLGLRNAAYGPAVRARVPVTGWRRPVVAMMTIDETTAVTVAAPDDATGRRAFRLTATSLYVTWSGGTLLGARLGDVLDPTALGLDAAVPVVFFALVWPALDTPRTRTAALAAAALSVLLVPVVPVGVPVVAAAAVGVATGWRTPPGRREEDGAGDGADAVPGAVPDETTPDETTPDAEVGS